MASPTSAGSRRLLARLLVIVVGAGLLGFVQASPAVAHAQLVRTSPADGSVLDQAPEHVEFEFNEVVALIDGTVRLFPAGREAVPLTVSSLDTVVSARLPAGLSEGAYTVSYRVVSADGHPVSGATSFRIGAGPPPAAAPAVDVGTPAATEAFVVGLTVVQYVSLLLLAGLVMFHRLVLRPVEGVPAGDGSPAGWRRERRLLRWSLGGAITSSGLLIPVSGVRVLGGWPWEVFCSPAWIGALGWPTVAGGLLVLIAGSAGVWALERRSRSVSALAVPLAVLALAAPVLVGHTRTFAPVWLMMGADLGHLLAGSFWFGGVVGLGFQLAAIRESRGRLELTGLRALAHTVSRFSALALAAVALLAVSGLTMGTLIVGSLDALLSAAYGRTLLLKLGIVVPILAFAGWNRFVLLPRILVDPRGRRSWRTLTRTLRNEAALLVAVVAVTGLLTNTSPEHAGHDHASGSGPPAPTALLVDATSQGMVVSGTLVPGAAGSNRLTFTLTYQGRPLSVEDVALSARLPAQDLGPIQCAVTFDVASGSYAADLPLPASGRWQLQVSARVDTFTKPVALVELEIE